MAVFFIQANQIEGGIATIADPLLAHLRASLRMVVGEHLWLSDEHRHRYLAQITQVNRQQLRARVVQELNSPPARTLPVTLAQALLKGDRMDWVIQKATELGVAAVIPFLSARSIVRPKTSRLPAQVARWQRIALEAAQQSEQWVIPSLSVPQELTKLLARDSPGGLCRLILAERTTGKSLTTIALPAGDHPGLMIAVGPEGGWTEDEITQALAAGFTAVTLGSRILRADTAAIAALSVVQSRLGKLG